VVGSAGSGVIVNRQQLSGLSGNKPRKSGVKSKVILPKIMFFDQQANHNQRAKNQSQLNFNEPENSVERPNVMPLNPSHQRNSRSIFSACDTKDVQSGTHIL
jgi:hypothetical protein